MYAYAGLAIVRAAAVSDKDRVVITGQGIASVFGNDVDTFYNRQASPALVASGAASPRLVYHLYMCACRSGLCLLRKVQLHEHVQQPLHLYVCAAAC